MELNSCSRDNLLKELKKLQNNVVRDEMMDRENIWDWIDENMHYTNVLSFIKLYIFKSGQNALLFTKH